MTKEKAKQAWIDLHKGLDYIQGRDDFKSSLKRDIEKRISELEQIALVNDQWNKIDIQISECKRFLELIETVEP
ncbi:MAG TPA: hypothetical protein VL443_24525 [Cyclobacteriaceae bacterium]|jgi:hypothetical protein|nr:hypothetical protein [Cyclobacteriaceae bacterium]